MLSLVTQPSEVFLQQMRLIRKSEACTQADLAQRVEAHLGHTIDASTIARIESGRRSLRLDEAVAIAKALGMRLDDMLPSEYTAQEEAVRLEHELAQHHAKIDDLEREKHEMESSATVIELRLAELRDQITEDDG